MKMRAPKPRAYLYRKFLANHTLIVHPLVETERIGNTQQRRKIKPNRVYRKFCFVCSPGNSTQNIRCGLMNHLQVLGFKVRQAFKKKLMGEFKELFRNAEPLPRPKSFSLKKRFVKKGVHSTKPLELGQAPMSKRRLIMRTNPIIKNIRA
jgi:hypothetical protein